jgi:hypothetical protein
MMDGQKEIAIPVSTGVYVGCSRKVRQKDNRYCYPEVSSEVLFHYV